MLSGCSHQNRKRPPPLKNDVGLKAKKNHVVANVTPLNLHSVRGSQEVLGCFCHEARIVHRGGETSPI